LVYDIDDTTDFINVTSFNAKTDANDVKTTNFSLDNGTVPFKGRRKPKFGMMF